MLWYLDHDRLIGTAYGEAVRRRSHPRVWALAIPAEEPPIYDITQALSEYRVADRIDVRGMAAVLYVPDH